MEDEDIELNNVKSPASYFNISSRAPLHSLKELDSTLEDDILSFEEVIINERKRKFDNSSEQEQKSSKIRKLWGIMKYPFQKIIASGALSENELNVSNSELVIQKESIVSQIVEHKNNSEKDTEGLNTSNPEIAVENNSECTTNTRNFCNIM